MPFGGAKASGHSRFGKVSSMAIPVSHGMLTKDSHPTGGPEGLRSLCNLKVISEDIFFSTIKTSIPPVLGKLQIPYLTSRFTLLSNETLISVDYPLKNASKAWIFASGLTWLAFADSWVGSGKGLTEVIRGAL